MFILPAFILSLFCCDYINSKRLISALKVWATSMSFSNSDLQLSQVWNNLIFFLNVGVYDILTRNS